MNTTLTPPVGEDRLLKPAEAARYFGLTKWTLEEWRKNGRGPKFITLNRGNIRYRLSDIQTFIADQKAAGGSQVIPSDPARKEKSI